MASLAASASTIATSPSWLSAASENRQRSSRSTRLLGASRSTRASFGLAVGSSASTSATGSPLRLKSERRRCFPAARAVKFVASARSEPLKVIIAGAPASGKGTQCELITAKYGLVHISAGDLLRAEVAAGTENGRQAKEYMDKGSLVPDGIVVTMVKERLMQPDSQEKGWLLDGYPRSLSQATAVENFGIRPDIFILLEVPDEILVERVVGRRLDPVTGKIYHLKFSPPENDEIASRLMQRSDDTEEKVKLRLKTHYQNIESVISIYDNIMVKVNGYAPKEVVFGDIEKALNSALDRKAEEVTAQTA